MPVPLKKLSKGMAQALRHQPVRYGLELDEEGWVLVADLLAGLCRRRHWCDLTVEEVQAVLAMPGKQRYEMKNGRIRALYGHSTHVMVHKETAVPPPFLYHGTAPETVSHILQEGLRPKKRQFVHLSVDVETARMVGQRKARQPVILRVRAWEAYETAVSFYRGNDATWLADHIPPEFIEVLRL
ncbi:MAG: RNA 2'-phosphotransferase [Anaerolineae bacterium]